MFLIVLLGVLASLVSAKKNAGLEEGSHVRNVTKVSQGYSKVIYKSVDANSDIWFTFMQMYGFPSLRVNSTFTVKKDKKVADFRVIPVRLIEFNDTISVEQSKSIFEFEGKQQQWSQVTVEEISVEIDQKPTNIVRMNATLTLNSFKYVMNVYLTDRSCFYGNYNLDADAAFIVQNIQNYPYKYSASSLAIEQIVASRDSGTVGSYLGFLDSPFLASLVINPEAQDSKLGRLPMTISDFIEVEFKTVTGDMARESLFEQVVASVESEKQPSDLFVEEKLAINLGNNGGSNGFGNLAGGNGSGSGYTGSGSGSGAVSSNGSVGVESTAFLPLLALLMLVLLL